MALVELVMPKMGESIMEATILKWLIAEGDTIELDQSVLEIATDKVDSDVPSPVAGVLQKQLFAEDEVVPVGTAIAIIATEGEQGSKDSGGGAEKQQPGEVLETVAAANPQKLQVFTTTASNGQSQTASTKTAGGRFYSPLVLNIARQESISMQVLETLPGTGREGRVTKKDILAFVKSGKQLSTANAAAPVSLGAVANPAVPVAQPTAPVAAPGRGVNGEVEIVEMDRMRKLIADHMVMSKRVSPHVTSFVEADVTNLYKWRERVKRDFEKREGTKITFTPIFVEAVAKALRDFPGVNVSVDGHNILYKKDINIGIATALPSGNLIVPVIKDASGKNLAGLARSVNDLVGRARTNKLRPDDTQGGTFTLTNVGTFGNLSGTPIINQPQAAILATGSIKKKPAVVETEYGDLIAVRHLMFLSLSYDHRVVDGFLGGSFLRRVADYLEGFDPNRDLS